MSEDGVGRGAQSSRKSKHEQENEDGRKRHQRALKNIKQLDAGNTKGPKKRGQKQEEGKVRASMPGPLVTGTLTLKPNVHLVGMDVGGTAATIKNALIDATLTTAGGRMPQTPEELAASSR